MERNTNSQQNPNINNAKFDQSNAYYHGISGSDIEFTKRYDPNPKSEINSFNVAVTGYFSEQVEQFVHVWHLEYGVEPAKSIDRAIEIGINHFFDELQRGVTPKEFVELMYETNEDSK